MEQDLQTELREQLQSTELQFQTLLRSVQEHKTSDAHQQEQQRSEITRLRLELATAEQSLQDMRELQRRQAERLEQKFADDLRQRLQTEREGLEKDFRARSEGLESEKRRLQIEIADLLLENSQKSNAELLKTTDFIPAEQTEHLTVIQQLMTELRENEQRTEALGKELRAQEKERRRDRLRLTQLMGVQEILQQRETDLEERTVEVNRLRLKFNDQVRTIMMNGREKKEEKERRKGKEKKK